MAHKLYLEVQEVNIVGHTCNFEGHIPDKTRVAKIFNWPPCESTTEARGFLGTCGVVRIFSEGFSQIARLLVNLTHKDAPFVWEQQQQESMDLLKDHVTSMPVLIPIEYTSCQLIIMAIDSSLIAVGWIVYQLDVQGL